MARLRKAGKKAKVYLLRTSCLIEQIIEISGDGSGHGVTVILKTNEEVFFEALGRRMEPKRDIGDTIYQALLEGLRRKYGQEPKGFHWTYDSEKRLFRTYNYGLYD